MYSHRLDTPPPPSHFRRPWSPAELESYGQLREQRREASDSSFEALDLADYAMTLQQRTSNVYATPAPLNNTHYPDYAPPPRSYSLASRSDYTGPPSLVSGSTSASSHPHRLRTPTHRPYSLPVTTRNPSAPVSRYGNSHNYPGLLEDPSSASHTNEVDISAFPHWSRGWYDAQKPAANLNGPSNYYPSGPDFIAPPKISYAPHSNTSISSQRDLLPWSMEDDSHGMIVTPEMKEERVKLLEKEFASNAPGDNDWMDDSKVIGSVNAKGKIVTPGPKKRAIFRWVQGTFAFGAVVASLYSAAVCYSLPLKNVWHIYS